MRIQLLRHATLLLDTGRKKILVDPMLSEKDALDPVPMAPNDIRIPMTGIPLTAAAMQELIASVDAVLVTHTHRDHWDVAAQLLLPKGLPVLCQPQDEATIRQQGFTQVQAVADTVSWEGLQLHRTGGRHGTGEIGERMGPVSGFVIRDGDASLYIAGDTIWCPEVAEALDTYHPACTIVNAGAARFVQGDPITMTAEEVITVCRYAPYTQVIAMHMDTVNHCLLTRKMLREALAAAELTQRCLVPEDGETIA